MEIIIACLCLFFLSGFCMGSSIAFMVYYYPRLDILYVIVMCLPILFGMVIGALLVAGRVKGA